MKNVTDNLWKFPRIFLINKLMKLILKGEKSNECRRKILLMLILIYNEL